MTFELAFSSSSFAAIERRSRLRTCLAALAHLVHSWRLACSGWRPWRGTTPYSVNLELEAVGELGTVYRVDRGDMAPYEVLFARPLRAGALPSVVGAGARGPAALHLYPPGVADPECAADGIRRPGEVTEVPVRMHRVWRGRDRYRLLVDWIVRAVPMDPTAGPTYVAPHTACALS